MRKKVIRIIFLILIVCLGYFFNRFSFSKPLYKEKIFSTDSITTDSILTIGIIGDSWVQYGSLDTIIHNRLTVKNTQNIILTSGNEGASSREIYENMYKPNRTPFSSQNVINKHPKYCIVISGINDSNRQLGKKYYSYHLMLILESLLKENIKPIVISIPNYGIEEEFNMFNDLKKLRFKIFSIINNHGKINNIEDYNDFFLKELNKKQFKDSIIYIDTKSFINNFNENKNLFYDHLHLNLSGKQNLGKIIADSIISRELKPE